MIGPMVTYILVALVLLLVVVRLIWVFFTAGFQLFRYPFAVTRRFFGMTGPVRPQITLRRLRASANRCKVVMPSGVLVAASEITLTLPKSDYAALINFVNLDETERDLATAYSRYMSEKEGRFCDEPTKIIIDQDDTYHPGTLTVKFHRSEPNESFRAGAEHKSNAGLQSAIYPATLPLPDDQDHIPTETATTPETQLANSEISRPAGPHLKLSGNGVSFEIHPMIFDGRESIELRDGLSARLLNGFGPIVCGRGIRADVDLQEELISRSQFSLIHRDGIWVIRPDTSTTNTTFVGGVELRKDHELNPGTTKVRIGRKLEYLISF